MSQSITIALAQLNFHVGAIASNTDKIIQAIHEMQNRADVLLFPELTLISYPPEDLLYRDALYQQLDDALERIRLECGDLYVIIGHPERQGNTLYNACTVMHEQQRVMTYYKQRLPNYGVFDEKRYFDEADKNGLLNIHGIPVALSICEDIWFSGPSEQAKQAGAELVLNINASPFHKHKQIQRREMLQQRARDTGLDIVYVNLVGGQDDLIFDGCSMAINRNGQIDFEATAFAEQIYTVTYHAEAKHFEHQYENTQLQGHALIYQALVTAVHDYVRKNGFKGVLLGLSGGIDSALTLAIAVDALGAENVEVVMMPSRYTLDMSNEDAEQQARYLGVIHHTIPIAKPFAAFVEDLQPWLQQAGLEDTTEENLQARCRGTLLMALSNHTGKMLLTTGNKSEMAVGYATLYGDMNGGYAPLKDVPKLLVYELARWRNRNEEIIPTRVIERPPSAELRPDQQDSDSLPTYDILDPILERYIENDISPAQIIAEGFDAETVKRVVRLVDINEYKRRQAAPGARITKRAFGRDRRYPITSGYREQ